MAVQEQRFASFFFVSIACHSAASPHIIVLAMLDLPYRQQSGVSAFFASVIAAGKLVVSIHLENGYIINEAQITLIF